MEFTISSNALSSRLQTLAKVISSKNSLPILECFLFEVNNGSLTITSSDSENMMKSTVALYRNRIVSFLLDLFPPLFSPK